MTGAMVNRNLLNARDAYRKKKGLLTSREIKMIRMENGLSQKEFAEMLGLDQQAIVRYETKAIQNEEVDCLLRNRIM